MVSRYSRLGGTFGQQAWDHLLQAFPWLPHALQHPQVVQGRNTHPHAQHPSLPISPAHPSTLCFPWVCPASVSSDSHYKDLSVILKQSIKEQKAVGRVQESKLRQPFDFPGTSSHSFLKSSPLLNQRPAISPLAATTSLQGYQRPVSF